MAGGNSLSSALREDDGGSVITVFRFGECAGLTPGTAGTDRVPAPAGYKGVVIHVVGGDVWVDVGGAGVVAARPTLAGSPPVGAGTGRYLAAGQEWPQPQPTGAGLFVAAQKVTGTPVVYVYGVGV